MTDEQRAREIVSGLWEPGDPVHDGLVREIVDAFRETRALECERIVATANEKMHAFKCAGTPYGTLELFRNDCERRAAAIRKGEL